MIMTQIRSVPTSFRRFPSRFRSASDGRNDGPRMSHDGLRWKSFDQADVGRCVEWDMALTANDRATVDRQPSDRLAEARWRE